MPKIHQDDIYPKGVYVGSPSEIKERKAHETLLKRTVIRTINTFWGYDDAVKTSVYLGGPGYSYIIIANPDMNPDGASRLWRMLGSQICSGGLVILGFKRLYFYGSSYISYWKIVDMGGL